MQVHELLFITFLVSYKQQEYRSNFTHAQAEYICILSTGGTLGLLHLLAAKDKYYYSLSSVGA